MPAPSPAVAIPAMLRRASKWEEPSSTSGTTAARGPRDRDASADIEMSFGEVFSGCCSAVAPAAEEKRDPHVPLGVCSSSATRAAVVSRLEHLAGPSTHQEHRILRLAAQLAADAQSCSTLANLLNSSGFQAVVLQGQDQIPADRSRFLRGSPSHAFVVVRADGEADGTDNCTMARTASPGSSSPTPNVLIVDPHFADAFAVARPTPAFAEVLSALPETFVGTPETLEAVIAVVSVALTECYAEQGLPLPPWRTRHALLARWSLLPAGGAAHRRALGGRAAAAVGGERKLPLGAAPAAPQPQRGAGECEGVARRLSPAVAGQRRRG